MNNPSHTWNPSPLEISMAQIAVLTDPLPAGMVTDALFVHGSPCRSDKLDTKILNLAAGVYFAGKTSSIVLNGMPAVEAAKVVCYSGYEPWEKFLLDRGIPKDKILLLPSSLHTAAESIALLNMAKEAGWDRLVISSQPHHQLRCFLQIIKIMQQMDFWPKVYNLTHDGVQWNKEMVKPVLGGGVIDGGYMTHIEAEFNRVVKYAQPPPTPESYTPHATIPEMLAYLERRG